MNAIIVGPDGRPSMLELMRTFKFNTDVTLFTYRRTRSDRNLWSEYSDKSENFVRYSTKEPKFTSGDKIIMWGTRIALPFPKGVIIYNKPRNAAKASNKSIARALFEKNKIATPKLIKDKDLFKTMYPVIIRKSQHRAGIGFYVANNDVEAFKIMKALHPDYYISEVYPKTEEYRIHCACGKALLVKRKPEPEDKSVIAWNFHQNELPWTTIQRKDYDHEMVSLALNAMDTIGLDFGAVDVMSNPKLEQKHVVVEINTAPSYTPYLIEKYGAFFDLAFTSEGKLEKWDHSKFKKGSSLSWKNTQLGIK